MDVSASFELFYEKINEMKEELSKIKENVADLREVSL